MTSQSKTVTIPTACPLTDAISCGLSVEVSDGVIKKVRPYGFADRIDRGACPVGLATAEIVNHPDRLRYPLKRAGERGEGKWQRVSWDEALDDIAARLKEIAGQYGSTSIAWGLPGGPQSLGGAGYGRLVSLTKGTRFNFLGAGDAANPCADQATFGWILGDPHLSRVENPKFTIVWGLNPDVTCGCVMRKITENKKKGCKVVVIDPRFTATAARADEHVPIRPGTDGALALGMIHVILEQGLPDEEFIVENTVGPLLVRQDNGLFLRESDLVKGGDEKKFIVFDENSGQAQPSDASGVKPSLSGTHVISGVECRTAYQLLKDMVEEYTPQKVSEITDVPVDVIRRLAIGYATEKPASIHRGWGWQRTFHGDLGSRAINTLAAITGNMNLKRVGNFMMNWQSFAVPGGSSTNIPIMLLADAVTKEEPFSVRALWCAGHNYLNQMPNMNRIINEVLPLLELIVVCDLFMTATAKYADYVLPVASFFECMDLRVLPTPGVWVPAADRLYLELQPKIIEPPDECKSDYEIAVELGRKMGFAEYFDKTEEQCIEEILTSDHPSMEGVTLERLKEGPIALKEPESPPQFFTPTGRIEFYVERLKSFGQELPLFLEPLEGARSELAGKYPLSLLTSHSKYRIHSSMANIPSMLKKDPEPTIEISLADAGARNIVDGDVVAVFNDRGRVKLKAKLTPGIKRGVVNIDQGWWPEHYIEGHHQELAHDAINPVQQFIFQPNAAFCDVLVEVKKV